MKVEFDVDNLDDDYIKNAWENYREFYEGLPEELPDEPPVSFWKYLNEMACYDLDDTFEYARELILKVSTYAVIDFGRNTYYMQIGEGRTFYDDIMEAWSPGRYELGHFVDSFTSISLDINGDDYKCCVRTYRGGSFCFYPGVACEDCGGVDYLHDNDGGESDYGHLCKDCYEEWLNEMLEELDFPFD